MKAETLFRINLFYLTNPTPKSGTNFYREGCLIVICLRSRFRQPLDGCSFDLCPVYKQRSINPIENYFCQTKMKTENTLTP